MYGIIKLQDKIAGDPGLGWRERYRAQGTEERPEVGHSPTGHARPEAERRHQDAGLDAPRGHARPEAERRHQDAGLDAPRR